MTQESRLVIVIDSKNAERNAKALAEEMSKVTNRGDSASQSTKDMGKQFSVTNNIVQNFNTTVNNTNNSVQKTVEVTRQATQQSQKYSQEIKNTTQVIDKQERSIHSYGTSISALAGYMVGLVTVGSAVSKMDLYTGINNKLKLVTNNQEELNLAMNDTFEIAQRSASSWSAVNDVYSKYMSNAKTLNLTQQETARLTEITSKAVAISGSNAESAAAALFQYGQALDGGVLRAEEFNSLVDGAGGLLNAMAKGLGVTRGELRQMMLDGKLTGEVITKALLQAGDSVEQLYGKTDKTVAQSTEMLSNAITKFVGESGKGTGAAQILAGSIQTLATNLDLIVDSAFVLGIGLMTKAVLTKTVAIQASIVASAQQRAANLAETQSQVQLLGVEAMRARQSAALAVTELGLARAEYNAATSANARAVAVQRLTAAEIAHSLATKEATAATVAYTVAQGNLNRLSTIGSRALSLVGGPIGAITLGITALAAGYMYFQDKAEQANKKLEEQAAVAKKAKEELLALRGLEKDSAINDMATSFERQNKALAESSSKINIQLNAIAQLYKGNKEIVQVVNDAKDGTISMNDAVKRFNELRISKEIYNSLKENTKEFEKNAKEAKTTKASLNLFGIEVELSGKKAQTAVAGIDENSKALIGNESAAQKATKAQKGYFDSLRNDVLNSNEELAYLNLGYSEEVIKKIKELEKAKQAVAPAGTNVIITNEEIAQIISAQKALDAVKEKKDAITEAEKKHTKELEKQQKVIAVNAKVQSLSKKYNISEKAAAAGIPQGLIEGMIMQESRGDTYRKGKLLTSPAGAQGLAQFMPATAKQYGVDVTSEQSSVNGMIKYVSDLLKQFGGDVNKAIMAYNAGPGNVRSGKADGFKETKQYLANVKSYTAGANGFKAGDISSKEFDKRLEDDTKLVEEQAKLRLQLENEVANQVTKIRNDLSKKLEDVDKANFSPERKAQIKAELQARAENDIAIAEQATKTKLDSFREYKKTEEQILKDSFAKRQFDAEHDLEMTKEQRKEAVNLLAEQMQQELALLKLAQEQRLFQARLFLLSETEAMKERYRLEREEILKNGKLKDDERQNRLDLSFRQERLDTLDKAVNASRNWDRTYADMTGNSQQYQLNQNRIDQTAQSLNLANNQDAVLDLQSKDPNANLVELAAQREQIWTEHKERMKLIESTYQNESISLQLGYGANVTGALAGMFKSMLGESSSAYHILYESQRAFALAQAGMNMWKAASDAYANEPGTWYQKAAAAAIATIKSGTFVSLIQAATPQGFADGGYTGNGLKHTPAGVVHKGEVVWSQDDIKRWGGVSVVESMRQSSPSGYADGGYVSNNQNNAVSTRRESRQFDAINSNQTQTNTTEMPINVYVTVSADGSSKTETQNDSRELGQMIGNAVRTIIRQEQRQGGLLSK
ncbi:tape measure protein [Acinetobacter calcoaceticus]|uniref:tape measure protein n=1 Tax=Acinetobacter calcoaceticus TaxID=471 RepID=UPI001D1711AD|nr:tape measure protein [Acinetobacter calcoaceticus]